MWTSWMGEPWENNIWFNKLFELLLLLVLLLLFLIENGSKFIGCDSEFMLLLSNSSQNVFPQ